MYNLHFQLFLNYLACTLNYFLGGPIKTFVICLALQQQANRAAPWTSAEEICVSRKLTFHPKAKRVEHIQACTLQGEKGGVGHRHFLVPEPNVEEAGPGGGAGLERGRP